MIIPLPLVISLLLAISYATEYDFKLDLDRCGKDTACFVRQSCFDKFKTDAADKNKLGDYPQVDAADGVTPLTMTDPNCDLVIQIKELTAILFLVFIKLDGSKLKFEEGIKIVQGTDEMHCKKDTAVGNNDPSFTVEYQKLSDPKFDNDMMSCLFLLKSANKRIAVNSIFDENVEFPTVEYKTEAADEKVVYGHEKDVFWLVPMGKVKCPLNKIIFDGNSEIYELTELDTSKPEMKCDGGNKMMIKFEGNDYKADEIKCETDKWSWTDLETSAVKSADRQFDVKAACIGKKFCTTCGDLLTTVADCKPGECTAPENTEEEECPVYKCADNKFTLDGKVNLISEKGVTCGKSGDGFKWLVHDTDGPGTEIESAVACRSFKACRRDDIKTACPADTVCLPDGPNINMETFNVTCAPGFALMNKGNPASGFSCDTKAGTWTPPGITEGNTYCEMVKVANVEKKVSQGSAGTVIGVVVGVIVALCLVGTICYYFLVYKKKEGGQVKTKQPSKKGVPSSDGSAESKPGPPSSDPPAAGPSKSDP